MMNELAAMAAPAAAPSSFASFDAGIDAPPDQFRQAMRAAFRQDEATAVAWLLAAVRSDDAERRQAAALATRLVGNVRSERSRASGVDALMQAFSLSSEEGIALMCLAEALLRIPDRETADRLIAEKISHGDWRSHLGESPSLFVNAATWALVISGMVVAHRATTRMSWAQRSAA